MAQRPSRRGLGRRGLPLLLAVASSGAAVAGAAGADSAEELALALGGDELVPGTIVGQGRYVLAEKLGDVHHRPQQAVPHRHQARLPPPSDRLLLDRPEDTVGQLVPYEGLARAIASDLPQLPQLPSPTPQFLPAVFDYSVSFVRDDPLFHEETWGYRFGQRLGKGSFGEAWRGVALDGSMREVVLKRLFVERGEHVRLSGEREIYFGSVLQNRPHVARFLESFEQQRHGRAGAGRGPGHAHRDPSGQPPELWLVFHNEGFSLSHHLFRMQPGSMLPELSAFWWTVKRQQPVGGQVIKSLIYQLLHGVAVAHDMNFTHRDIKPSNVFVTDTWPPVVRLGDWGSALAKPITEEFAKLYGKDGPTEGDETDGYQPPEVIFDSELLARTGLAKAGPWRDVAYDLWSLGVLLLELILGTREVFHVEERRWLRIEHSLRRQGVPTSRLGQARQLQAMLDLCLAPRSAPAGADVEWFFTPRPEEDEAEAEEEAKMSRPRGADVASAGGAGAASCSDEAFAEVLRRRDAAGVGLPSAAGRDLLRRLLEWSPEDRISARAALAHSWFDDGAQLPPLRSIVPVGGRRRQLGAASLAGVGGEAGASEEEDEEGEAEGSSSGDGGPEERQLQSAPPYMAAGWRWAAEASCGKESSCGGSPDTETAEADGPAGSGALLSGCPGLWLHAAVHSDIGRRVDMEDRYAVYNLSATSGKSTEAIPGAGFLGVFDGHGGSAIAERLQRSLHQHFAADPSFPENVSTALKGAFATFDEMLLRERAKALGGLPIAAVEAGREAASRGGEDPGSTALVCVATGCRLHLANLGDCRAVAALRAAAAAGSSGAAEGERPWPPGSRVEVRESPSAELRGQRGTIVEVRSASHKLYVVRLFRDGALRPLRQGSLRLLSELRAQRLTEDHKPGAEAERRRIEELGGEVEPPAGRGGLSRIRGLATSRSFGSLRARPFVSTRPDVREYSLDPERDVFIVLASDGIWDVLDDQLVVDLIWDQISSVHDSRRGPTAALEDAAQLIVQSALDRGALDNLTCAVLLFSWTACSGDGCEAKDP